MCQHVCHETVTNKNNHSKCQFTLTLVSLISDFWSVSSLGAVGGTAYCRMRNWGRKWAQTNWRGEKKMPPATQKKLSAIILACSLELAMPPLTQPVAPLALATQLLRPMKWDKSSGSTFRRSGGWEEKKMSRNIWQKRCVCRLVALNETTGSSSFVSLLLYLKSYKKCLFLTRVFKKKLELHLFLFLVK